MTDGMVNLELKTPGELLDEIMRLRAVLESLTKDPPSTLAREPDEDWEVIVKMRKIASDALAFPNGEP